MGKQTLVAVSARCAPLALLTLAGCSGAARLGGGPVVSYVRDERRIHGAEVLARAAAGMGEEVGFGAVEAASRLQITPRTQLASFGIGPAWFGTFGHSLITMDFTPMLGAQRIDEKIMALTSVRFGGGFGFALERDESRHAPLWATHWNMNESRREEVTVDTTALTLELVGGIDFPATREAQISAGVLVGIAWLTQRYDEELPALPPRPWTRILAPRPRP